MFKITRKNIIFFLKYVGFKIMVAHADAGNYFNNNPRFSPFKTCPILFVIK